MADGRVESRRIANQMVGGQHQQGGFGIVSHGGKRGNGNGGSRIAAGWLQNQRKRTDADFTQLFCS